jgi:acid stress-induced BolA-like protein IbaG/YrbA
MSKVHDAIAEIETALTRRLKLQTPRFKLESAGAKVSGSIISSTFRGMTDSERQRKIWDALDAEYGANSIHRAGSFLAFTPDEWDLNDDSDSQE